MAARVSLRREHIVAASLVGSVVVVLGFASGLGIHHTTTAGTTPPAQAEGPPQTSAAQPTGDVGQSGNAGQSGDSGQQGPRQNFVGTPVVTLSVSPSMTMPTGSSPPVSTSPTSVTGQPVPTTTQPCAPGLVPVALKSVTSGVQELPLLGSVVSAVPLPVLLDSLLGSCAPAPTTTTTPGS